MWSQPGRIRRLAVAVVAIPLALTLALTLTFYTADALSRFPVEEVAAILHEARAADPGTTPRMDEDGRWRSPVSLKAVAPSLVDATIAVEDKRYRSHPGVDVVALARAALHALVGRHGGGSTITMQTVRLLWPREPGVPAMLAESFRALQMEQELSKDDILELYFNLAPYGSNIIGAEAAARRYFQKSAAELELGEAALLAGLPRAPGNYDPRLNPHAARQRRWQVLDRMLNDGYVSLPQATRADKLAVRLRGVPSADAVSRCSRLGSSDYGPLPATALDTAMPQVFHLEIVDDAPAGSAVPATQWIRIR
ncbi:MAG: transglycosylase domain-containing protein [Planctomycetaceae bacterium]|nr:transglycosylase domain-containing protein [Planctomycetaceae bacterium]